MKRLVYRRIKTKGNVTTGQMTTARITRYAMDSGLGVTPGGGMPVGTLAVEFAITVSLPGRGGW